ncbi:MAG: Hpt domain-containing protein [Firmicutes bacterium]|jgi:HPt (histidine-containing phosphotransfer) domain-containing protein|nr:Hpt domain-containing protein [Bacillota bacterium]
MTLKECYAALGGDYEDVVLRLRSDRMIQKFVFKFLDDPSYGQLCHGIEIRDREEAFRAAHTIKGVCQNLSFTKLYRSSSALCDALRNDWGAEADDLVKQVHEDYELTAGVIRAFQEEMGE